MIAIKWLNFIFSHLIAIIDKSDKSTRESVTKPKKIKIKQNKSKKREYQKVEPYKRDVTKQMKKRK